MYGLSYDYHQEYHEDNKTNDHQENIEVNHETIIQNVEMNSKSNVKSMNDLDKLQEASWSSTVDVVININITKLLDIDTVNQRFQAEAIVESKWFDPNIKSFQDILDEKKMWKPDLFIENGVKDIKEEITYKIVPTLSEDSNVLGWFKPKEFMLCETRKVSGIFFENLELEDFPLDVQDLTIHVATKKPGLVVKLVPRWQKKEDINVQLLLDRTMWKLYPALLMSNDSIVKDWSYGRRYYPAVKGSLKVFRQPYFYFW